MRTIHTLTLDLADHHRLREAIAAHDLVVHCAGPFRQRDANVLATCIQEGVHYVDVSDDRHFTQLAFSQREAAKAAGVTAIVNTGVFPGISNSLVRQGIEQFDRADEVHLSYVVASSGGAGITVMRTTFLNIQNPFEAWIDGQWQPVQPYTDREVIAFPGPFGRTNVYWFDMPESYTLVESYPLKTVSTKFGSKPDIYNRLTQMMLHRVPRPIMRNPGFVEMMAHISYWMTEVSDRFSGTGVAVRAQVIGEKEGSRVGYCANFVHPNAAVATGYGTGSIAQFILSGQINQPGVWAVEQVLTTELFEHSMNQRNSTIQRSWVELST
jgi:saccharopine dehydrogenase-like NADP-dependent oxidoreductase